MDGLYEQFRIALHSVWKRRWLALGVAWGLCLLGWLVIALIPNSYESKAKVLVQTQPILPSAMNVSPNDRQNELLRLRQTLLSTANLEKVVRSTDLQLQVANDRDLAAQVGTLRENIKVTSTQEDIFEISALSSVAGFSNIQNARTAAAIVQKLIDLFVEGNLSGNRTETGQTIAFLDEELRKREGDLRNAEQRRVEFETKFLGILPGEGSIGTRVSAARLELANLDQQITAAQSSLVAIRGQMAGTPSNIAGAGGAGPASSQLAALEGQLSQAYGRGWTEQHPDVQSLKGQIERLRPQAAAERRAGGGGGSSNPAFISLRSMMAEKEAVIAAANARKNQIQNDLTQLMAKQATEPEVAAEYSRLNRDYDVLKRQYDKLLEDREQIKLRGDVNSKADSIRFRVIDPPSQPTVPAKPNRPLFLTLILLVGAGAGVGAAFAKAQLQTTFPTIGRLEQVSAMPVIGSVSEVLTAEAAAERKQKMKWFAGAGGALAASYALLMLVEFWQRSTVA
jgi:polysaccharide biosynthesis transport protein